MVRASPIVFGPRTLVRPWGTRTELLERGEAVPKERHITQPLRVESLRFEDAGARRAGNNSYRC